MSSVLFVKPGAKPGENPEQNQVQNRGKNRGKTGVNLVPQTPSVVLPSLAVGKLTFTHSSCWPKTSQITIALLAYLAQAHQQRANSADREGRHSAKSLRSRFPADFTRNYQPLVARRIAPERRHSDLRLVNRLAATTAGIARKGHRHD